MKRGPRSVIVYNRPLGGRKMAEMDDDILHTDPQPEESQEADLLEPELTLLMIEGEEDG